jgi:hypothetical protein
MKPSYEWLAMKPRKRRIHSVLTKDVLKVAAGGTASQLDALPAGIYV